MQKIKVRIGVCLLPLCFVLLNLLEGATGAKDYSRHEFPPKFIFGASTSAYQTGWAMVVVAPIMVAEGGKGRKRVEGAALEDGRKPSIYDTFAHNSRYGKRNPDLACDEYHKYKEDVQLMVETGLDAYRFSISWSRVIPNGSGAVNPKGLQYYNNLINELINYGIEPHVTLMHTDLPQVLEDQYEGFLNSKIIEDFTTYVDVCFREFGDRVSYWTTFNEANIFVMGGYDVGITPPGRCSSPFGPGNCNKGNSTTEPYIATHNLLLAHASAVKLYKEKYQAKQHGFIGINLLCYHFTPITDTREDIRAAERAYDFFIGWIMHPLANGDYPEIMKKNGGTRIPIFTNDESKKVKGSFDFIGVNYYTAMVTKDNSMSLSTHPRDYIADMAVQWICQLENHNTSINDLNRVEYLQGHVGSLLDALRNGSNTGGYFVWSLMDVYELLFGFDYTFGLYYVDFNDPNLTRHSKLSQKWYSGFLKGENTNSDEVKPEKENTTIGPRLGSSVGNHESLRRHPNLFYHLSS
ncbi:putative beta-glucosidase 6 isoform X3 [Beta vulgaris subsp. vulgaris]|uniref:putative beta-glucosidase 6 isoform X3 n=1 Tax=Beta vulgaris subsp. vulgaris TaxID=3555 RepID=UPI0020375B9F|nr:putative beta-glucosidase 6 isoform X3 [Beta vulgaris subsp. vulgaris]